MLMAAPAQSGWCVLFVDRDPDQAWQPSIRRFNEEPHRVLRGKMINSLDPARDLDNCGRSRRGSATIRARVHPRTQPILAAKANQPSARPVRPSLHTKPPTGNAAAMQMSADDWRELPRVNQAAMPPAKPTTNQGGIWARSASRKASTPSFPRGKPRLPIAPSTLWKRRFPYVRGARPLHCSIERRGKRA
jgi:hypothetical protein